MGSQGMSSRVAGRKDSDLKTEISEGCRLLTWDGHVERVDLARG